MDFTESVVKDATLAWLESLRYAVPHDPDIAAPACRDGHGTGWGEPGAGGTSVGEVVVRDQYQMGVRWSCITVLMGVLG